MGSALPYSRELFHKLARTLAATGQRLYQQGWSPATSSNYSARLNTGYCAVTISGRDKALLTERDVMVVDLQNSPVSEGKPSAETGLHTQLYRRFPEVGAVLHTHSAACTALTMHFPEKTEWVLEGYELLKALGTIKTHDTRLSVKIFPNTQDIDALARDVDSAMDAGEIEHAYLIRGHGLYTWAKDIDSCYRQIEALETLFAIELARLQIGAR